MTRPVAIADQVKGAERAVKALEDEFNRARRANNASAMDELRLDLAHARAGVVTLRWLARDRDGCVKMLTTTVDQWRET